MMNAIPRLRFAHLPTPIEPLPRLTTALKGPRLWVKRDDQTGLAFGGNKTRKLEFLVAEAQAHGAHTLITAGAVQSNHCRQTAAVAARFGFHCILVLSGDKPAALSGNLLLDHLFGAQIIWTVPEQRQYVLQEIFEQAWQTGQRPYKIPVGGSNATGAAGYAYAIQELMQQCTPTDLPDWIVFSTSSGGTQAGMVTGARLFSFPGKILGITNDEPALELSAHVASLASQTCDLLGEPHHFQPQDIFVNDSFLGAGYGVLGEQELEAIHLFATMEGLLLDPVYTGRAAAGLIELCRSGFFKPDEKVLFWHTGGAPALFAEQYNPSHFNRSSS
jgi:D-cysteine desulfhydrase family pyridoxal phosphate-dependent enzyme